MDSILEMRIERNVAILIPPNDPRSLIVALTIIVVLFQKEKCSKNTCFLHLLYSSSLLPNDI